MPPPPPPPLPPHAEFRDTLTRRFLSSLFLSRARRHLRVLAEIYAWSPEKVAEMEQRFLRQGDFVPVFVRP